MLEELLPSPVLAVGLTGHRSIGNDAMAAAAIEDSIAMVFGALQRALAPAIGLDAAYFSPTAPIMRLITMGAEGADLLGTRAAGKCGLEIAYVIPFAWDEYRKDFLPASAAAAAENISRARSLLELPGRREEGPRAYERANEVILSNVDLLLAVWDGGRARGRAGTGDVVQGAVNRSVPIIVIDPRSPGTPTILATAFHDDFEPPAASDLDRRPLPPDLTGFVHAILNPSPKLVKRQGLDDLLREIPPFATWRFEYPLLLRIAGGRPMIRRVGSAGPSKSLGLAGGIAASSWFAFAHVNQLNLSGIERARETIDGLAVRYGRLFRSSSVSQYLAVILGVWISGVIGLLIQSLSAISIVVQLVANGLVLADSAFRTRRRWQERWLDYRVVAERLRWLRFRCAFGLGARLPTQPDTRRDSSWTDWYLQRMALALGPPQGRIDTAAVAAVTEYLTEGEIPGQISYHRLIFRQLGTLERRLSQAAYGALAAAVAVAALFAVAVIKAGSLEAVGWKPVAIALLAALPATMTALNGLRVDADLIRLTERSAQTIALLFRIRRLLLAAPDDYDHVAANMNRLASILGNELAEWRFVIESRRSRGSRRQIRRKSSVLRPLREPRRSG